MIKQKLEELQRQRIKKMSNLLPDLVAEKKSPSFFYYAKEPYIDFEELCKKPFEYKPLPREDPLSHCRRIVNLQARKSRAYNMMGNQLRLSVDDADTRYSLQSQDEQGRPIRFQPYSLQRAALYDKGCITCGGPNLVVTYHGERHICLKCRENITTLSGDPVVIFRDDDGEVVVVGMSEDESHTSKNFYFVNTDELKINGYRCYVTFSGENELIILLHDRYNDNHPSKIIPPSALYQSDAVHERKLKGKNFVQLNKKKVKQLTH